MAKLTGDNWKMVTQSVALKHRMLTELPDMTDEDRLVVLMAIVRAAPDDDALDRIGMILSECMSRSRSRAAHRPGS